MAAPCESRSFRCSETSGSASGLANIEMICTLRVQIISMFANPEALPLVSETLVRFDEHGDPQPALARGWQSDPDKKRWRFIVRPKAAPAAAIAAGLRPALRKVYRDVTVTSNAQSIVIQSAKSMPDILYRLSRPAAGIPGTGPFRVTKWEPGRRAVLTANEDYLGGRPSRPAGGFRY